jgi:hypothetical protein
VRLRCTANGKVSERKQDIGIRIKPIIFARFGYRDQRILIDDSDHSSRSGVGDLRAPIRVPAHIECRVLTQSGSPDSVLDRCIGLFAALLLRIRRLELEPTRQDASTAIVSGLRLLQKIKSPTNNSPVIAVLSGKPSALRAAVRSPTVVPAARTMTIVAQ